MSKRGGERVVVSRSAGGYRDRLRKYRVLIDGIEIGRIKRGERVEAIVTPGAHTLSIVIDWKRKDLTVQVAQGEARYFICSPGPAKSALRDLSRGNEWVSMVETDELSLPLEAP